MVERLGGSSLFKLFLWERKVFLAAPFQTAFKPVEKMQNLATNRNWLVVSNMFYFHPYLGKKTHFDQYFSTGLKPPTREGSLISLSPFATFFWGGEL